MYFPHLDQLRIFLHIIRCMMHLSVPFMLLPSQVWPLRALQGHTEIADAFVFLVHVFVMESFFMLNGFFAIKMLDKYKIKAFLLNRLHRIGIPFLLGMLLLVPYILTIGIAGKQGIEIRDAFPQVIAIIKTGTPTMAHLWSLFYLLLIYLIYLFLYKYLKINNLLQKLSIKFILLFVILISTLCLFTFHRKYTLMPMNTWLELKMLLYFFMFFLLGVWYYLHQDSMEKLTVSKPLIISIFLVSLLLNLIFQKSENPNIILHFFGAMAYVTQALSCLILVWILFKKHPISSRLNQKWNLVMYWMYWIEVPIAITFHYFFLNKINGLAIVVGATIFTLWLSYFSYFKILKKGKIGSILGF